MFNFNITLSLGIFWTLRLGNQVGNLHSPSPPSIPNPRSYLQPCSRLSADHLSFLSSLPGDSTDTPGRSCCPSSCGSSLPLCPFRRQTLHISSQYLETQSTWDHHWLYLTGTQKHSLPCNSQLQHRSKILQRTTEIKKQKTHSMKTRPNASTGNYSANVAACTRHAQVWDPQGPHDGGEVDTSLYS